MNLLISTSTISRILRQYNMISSRALRKARITIISKQRRVQVDWWNEHVSWSVQDWSMMIFINESNYVGLNRIQFRCFCTDRTRF